MTRQKRDQKLLRDQCMRVTVLLSFLEGTETAISQALGHANASTLSRVRAGTTFLDSETLAKLGTMDVQGIAVPNLHWVLTGVGSPFLGKPGRKTALVSALCDLASHAFQKKACPSLLERAAVALS